MDTNQLVSPLIVPKWRPLLACLAWTVSFLGSLCSSQILGQAAISRTFAGRLQWTALASVTFGFCSIFSLHYIALLAQELPVPVHHDPLLTVLSAGIAVLFTFLALSSDLILRRLTKEWRRRQPSADRPPLIGKDSGLSTTLSRYLGFQSNSRSSSIETCSVVQPLLGEDQPGSVESREEAEIVEDDFTRWHAEQDRPNLKEPHNSFLANPDQAGLARVPPLAFHTTSPSSGSDNEDFHDGEEEPDLEEGLRHGRQSARESFISSKTIPGFFSKASSGSSSPSPSTAQSRSNSITSFGTWDTDDSSGTGTLNLSWRNFGVSKAMKSRLKASRNRKAWRLELRDRLVWTFTNPRDLLKCSIWAAAVCCMHYVGVSAMHIQDGYITWNLWLVALSYLIAYVDTLLANSCLLGSEQRISRQIVFGAVAATGIFAMHFTGQAAATFHSSAAPGTGGSNVPTFLIIMIAASAVATCLVSNIVLAHVTATTRDRIIETVITKRRLWRLMAQKEAAESANSLKSDFISVASHEIRTPLHSITGYTDLLGRTDLDEEQLLYLTNISRAVHTIQLITRQVLDFSRMERSQGELEARPTNVDIRDMVQGLSSMPEERSSEAKHVALNVFVDPQCPKTAFVDETYLTRVLMNLLANAQKFTVRGHVLLKVDFVPEANELLFEVEDTGVGIPEKFQANLFDPFTQADQSLTRKSHVGFGLGLAIAKQLTNRLQGSLSVHSVEKKGSTFSVRIPYKQADEAPENTDAEISGSPAPDPAQSAARSRSTIKVCGKVTATRKSIAHLLCRFGFDATEWEQIGSENEGASLAAADYVWCDPEWATKHIDLIQSLLRRDALPAHGDAGDAGRRPKPIICFTFNSTEDLAAVPGLNSAFNVLRLRRPIIFHQTSRILDNPLPFLTTSQREFQLPKAVRFASSIHSAASTPASEAEEGDAFSEERARERQSFGEALDAQHPEPISEAELLPRLCKILLVEDNPINQRLGCRVLQKLNYETSLAKDGREAVEMVLSTLPDVVLMDLSMPVMNGFDATKEIRRLEKTGRLLRHTPIIALTANAGAESEEECVKAGMDAFLTKPLSMATLSTALEKFIAAGPIITGVQLL